MGGIALDRPVLMGVLNTTPDSFWHQSRSEGPEGALRQAEAMLEGGAAILDVGGESTRPGAEPVSPGEERRRVVPVVEALVRRFPGVHVSVDTVKGETARAALEAGAAAVNDVSGLRLDPTVADAVRDAGAGLILMHSRGAVADMATYELAAYGPDVVGEVIEELAVSLAEARGRGVPADAIALDPGLGFSKTTAHSVAVLRELERFAALGHAVVVGPSRKRFVGELAGGLPPELRLPGTIAACVVAYQRGARILRVHDVAEARRALDVAAALVDRTDL
ncbi:MAG: dihydropteroate synthase [Gemmatimonadota bacterium]